MACPKCGNKEAFLLLTHYQCSNRSCKNWAPICPDCDGKIVIDLEEQAYVCEDCGLSCS